MIDVVLGALALAAFGGLTVAADRKIRSLQMSKKPVAQIELPDGIYFGKIVGTSVDIEKGRFVFNVRLDSGDVQIKTDEQGAHQLARKLKESSWQHLTGVSVVVRVELGEVQILMRKAH